MGNRRGAVTATEFIAELVADPEYVARREAAEAEREKERSRRAEACKPVLADLASRGVDLASLWDLYKQPESYSLAIPVLLSHLQREYSERTLEDIGHALPFKPDAAWWGGVQEPVPDNT